MRVIRMAMLAFTSLALFTGTAVPVSVASLAHAGASDRIVEGRRLYDVKGCYQCHGYQGQGSIMSGPALAGRSLSAERIRGYARRPTGSMPPYRSKILPDDELDAIIAFILAFPIPTPAREISLLARFTGTTPVANAGHLSQPTGKTAPGPALYRSHCSICHGPRREGATAPALTGEAAKRSMLQTVQIILSPPPGMPELSPDPLTQAQVYQVARFVRGE